ncbi:PAS domain-containing protein [Heyndrickxia coagulans]|uniref:PAS domain-containing protein n=1 Tax=Heyndrickxia coagulans TaxID=1398 RepID=UPI001F2C77CA|nr:PAS domain S-box protein [Heyndrickxia coagulans]
MGTDRFMSQKKRGLVLRDHEQLYRTLFLEAMDAIVFWDQNGRILLANEAALKIFECTMEEFIGKKLSDFVYVVNGGNCREFDRLNHIPAAEASRVYIPVYQRRKLPCDHFPQCQQPLQDGTDAAGQRGTVPESVRRIDRRDGLMELGFENCRY